MVGAEGEEGRSVNVMFRSFEAILQLLTWTCYLLSQNAEVTLTESVFEREKLIHCEGGGKNASIH
jgi:hypothetical protein